MRSLSGRWGTIVLGCVLAVCCPVYLSKETIGVTTGQIPTSCLLSSALQRRIGALPEARQVEEICISPSHTACWRRLSRAFVPTGCSVCKTQTWRGGGLNGTFRGNDKGGRGLEWRLGVRVRVWFWDA